MCERRKLDHAEALVEEARAAGLDVERFRLDLRSHAITEAFGADLEATAALAAEQARERRPGLAREPAARRCRRWCSRRGRPRAPVCRAAAATTPTATAAEACGRRAGRPARLGVEEAVAASAGSRRARSRCCATCPARARRAELWRLAEQWKLRPRAAC